MRCQTEEFPSSNVLFLGDKEQILMLKTSLHSLFFFISTADLRAIDHGE